MLTMIYSGLLSTKQLLYCVCVCVGLSFPKIQFAIIIIIWNQGPGVEMYFNVLYYCQCLRLVVLILVDLSLSNLKIDSVK